MCRKSMPACLQQRGQNPRMARHVGHLAGARKRNAEFAGDLRVDGQAGHQILQVQAFGLERHRQGVDDEAAFLHAPG